MTSTIAKLIGGMYGVTECCVVGKSQESMGKECRYCPLVSKTFSLIASQSVKSPVERLSRDRFENRIVRHVPSQRRRPMQTRTTPCTSQRHRRKPVTSPVPLTAPHHRPHLSYAAGAPSSNTGDTRFVRTPSRLCSRFRRRRSSSVDMRRSWRSCWRRSCASWRNTVTR